MEKFLVNDKGVFLGVFVGEKTKKGVVWDNIPNGSIEVSSVPDKGLQLWDFKEEKWVDDESKYRERRKGEYPDIGEQLDAIMKWVAGEKEITVTPELKSIAMQCMAVKSKYPKKIKK